jgi:N-acetylmuramoyl-L-alanine amidase
MRSGIWGFRTFTSNFVRWLSVFSLATLLLGGVGLAPGMARSAVSTVTDVRVGQKGQTTRLVLDLTDKVVFKVFALAKPYRIVIDLPEVGWRLPSGPLPAGIGMLKNMRYGLFQPGTSRIVLDVNKPPNIEKSFILKQEGKSGYRLVVDFGYVPQKSLANVRTEIVSQDGVPPGRSAASVVCAQFNSSAIDKTDIIPSSSAKRIIAIDPGHGGVDPGTIGASGSYEKHITLAMARQLQSELNKSSRFQALLTRKRDVFVSLRDRVARARDAGAELFISIHADATKNRKTRGLSVYTLSQRASDSDTAALAEKENKADLIAGINFCEETPEISNILIDLTRRESMNQSAKFAIGLVKQLRRQTKLLRNARRSAGFAVLKAPDVPSVLVELGFLSNPSDEKALKDDKFRAKLAKGMVRAVISYFSKVEEAFKK